MDSMEKMMILIVAAAFALFFGALLVQHYLEYRSAVKIIKMEKERSLSEGEYAHWKHELIAVRLTLLPGVSLKRAKKTVKFFNRGRHHKPNDKDSAFMSAFITSVVGICVCMTCLAGGTFAWFSASQNTGTVVLEGANYSVFAELSFNEGAVEEQNGVFALSKDVLYTLTLTADGTASQGYCIIELDGVEFHTLQFPSVTSPENKVFTVNILVDKDVSLKITPQWGTSSKQSWDKLQSNETLYQFKEGDTVASVAEYYGIADTKILDNNELNEQDIIAGKIIRIPSSTLETE